MANRAYLSIWTSSYSEHVMLDRFERLLETVPLSAKRPVFTSLEIRAVNSSEAPLVEQDLRGILAGPVDVIALAREHRNADSSYEVQGYWDVWQCDAASGLWRREPERLLLICNGQGYDDGIAANAGHFIADIGFEHLFTGHGGLLGSHGAFPSHEPPGDPAEAQFLALMTQEESLVEYHEKTRENVQQLMAWVRAIEGALPVEHYRLWSEGEENLAARLDDILTVR
jgi:hypothetical protein